MTCRGPVICALSRFGSIIESGSQSARVPAPGCSTHHPASVASTRPGRYPEDPVPTYQYACTECGHRFEAVQSFSDDSLTTCPVCSGALRKVYG